MPGARLVDFADDGLVECDGPSDVGVPDESARRWRYSMSASPRSRAPPGSTPGAWPEDRAPRRHHPTPSVGRAGRVVHDLVVVGHLPPERLDVAVRDGGDARWLPSRCSVARRVIARQARTAVSASKRAILGFVSTRGLVASDAAVGPEQKRLIAGARRCCRSCDPAGDPRGPGARRIRGARHPVRNRETVGEATSAASHAPTRRRHVLAEPGVRWSWNSMSGANAAG